MENWATGYTQSQLDEAQDRYGLRFPPDLIELFLERRPTDGYDWDREDPRIRGMLEWPFDLLLFDIEHGCWWPDWGNRPATPEERAAVLRNALARAPRLIPLFGHRFLPETPSETGNPVFSMHGFDTIYYGANLCDHFEREFSRTRIGDVAYRSVRHIPFWSDIVENNVDAYPDFDGGNWSDPQTN
jgi:hypothetical protein